MGTIVVSENITLDGVIQDPSGDVIEEVTIVGDGDDRTGVILEETFQPRH